MANTPDPAPGAPASQKNVPSEADVKTEVKARVMWGEDPQAIRADFVRQGVRPGEVDTVLRRSVQERKDYYRSQGRRNILHGSLLTAAGIVIGVIMAGVFSGAASGARRIPVWFIIAPVAFPVYGILLVFKGLRRLKRPGEGESTAHGELEEDD
jgi:hypothetical protein